MGSATLNGKIYLIGGFIGGGVHRDGQNTAFEYDPASDTWRILPPMKRRPRFDRHRRAGRQAACHRRPRSRRQYGHRARGLRSCDQCVDGIGATVARARPPCGRRGRRKDLRCRRAFCVARAADQPARNLRRQDQQLVGRPEHADCSQRRRQHTLYKGLFMVLGGEFPPEMRTFSENEALDLKTSTWRTLAPMPNGRHATCRRGRQQRLPGGRLASARRRAGNRSAHGVQSAVSGGRRSLRARPRPPLPVRAGLDPQGAGASATGKRSGGIGWPSKSLGRGCSPCW